MALFCRAYPGLWCNAGWPTADKIIPWRLYEALLGELPAAQILEQLEGGKAVQAGIALGFADSLGQRMLIDQLLDGALGPEPAEGRPTYF